MPPRPPSEKTTRGRGDPVTRGNTDAPTPKRQSARRLRELQRLTASAIIRPLGRGNHTQSKWIDGRPMADVAAEFIKPNDRLTSYERLEIYNRQYWFRVLDCLYDDYPGLHAILGERKFYKLRIAYLTRYPSRSFSLRNLGSRLEQFLIEEPHWAHPLEAMALDMARFEWAQVVAFDGNAQTPLSADDLLGKGPSNLRLTLQPYITLLDMGYPLDDFVLAVKKRNKAMRSEASNAMEEDQKGRPTRRPRLPKPQRAFVAVHRFQNDLYYKRLTPIQYRLLSAFRGGSTIESACEAALTDDADTDADIAPQLRGWFQTWMELGWLCRGE